jgi:phosphoglycolate phosphatase
MCLTFCMTEASRIDGDLSRRDLLVLWDIDHTLVETKGVGTRLFGVAFARVTGIEPRRVVRADGRTEPDVFADTARFHGVDPSGELFAAFAAELVAAHEAGVAEMRRKGRALPGAADALAHLSARPGIRQSVVTGNLRGVASAKLRAYRLEGWLDETVGGYGSDDPDRGRLVGLARTRAGARYGAAYAGRDSVVIGDTPADVAAARAAGAAVIAVASGYSDVAALTAAGPDAVLPGLPDPEALLRLVLAVTR